MPRYFFNIDNSERHQDNEGVELSSPDAARAMAVIFAGDYLRDDPGLVWDGQRMIVGVRDEQGKVLLIITITAHDPG